MSPAFRRMSRFYFVGMIGIVVQLLVLAGLKSGLKLNYLLSTPLAVEVAIVHNFLWHQRFTWAERAGRAAFSRFLKFNLGNGVISVTGNIVGMAVLARAAKINYVIANLVSVASCSLLNFMISDRLVFVQRSGEP
jgi:putative flippase GtrA